MTLKASENSHEIFLVGLGVTPIKHLTTEAREVLERCASIFVVDHGFGIVPHLRSMGSEVVNLLDEYQEGRNRLITYQRMAARVVDRALDQSPIAFATYGHPSWLVYPTELIREAGRLLGLRVELVHGISSVDTVIGDLGIDPGTDGLQIHEATGFVKEGRQLDPYVPCLLLQVDAFDTPIFTTASRPESRYQPLMEYLMRFYGEDHEMVSVYSSTHPLMNPIKIKFPLSEMPKMIAQEVISGTLFISPISRDRHPKKHRKRHKAS